MPSEPVTTTTVRYKCSVEGINRNNQPETFWLYYSKYLSGCNPWGWDVFATETNTLEELVRQLPYISGYTWLCKSVDRSTIKFYKETMVITSQKIIEEITP